MSLAMMGVAALLSLPGLSGNDDKVEVPTTNAVWNATVTDDTLTETELTEFSWDGYTHVQGTLGSGTVSIRFEEITKIDVEPSETKNKSVGLVSLKAGGIKKIGLDGKTSLYGKTGFGNFKILVKDVRKIVFTAGPLARASPASSPPKKQ